MNLFVYLLNYLFVCSSFIYSLLLSYFFKIFYFFSSDSIGQRLVARLRKFTFSSIMIQDIEFFDVSRTGDLTNRYEREYFSVIFSFSRLSSDIEVLQLTV